MFPILSGDIEQNLEIEFVLQNIRSIIDLMPHSFGKITALFCVCCFFIFCLYY